MGAPRGVCKIPGPVMVKTITAHSLLYVVAVRGKSSVSDTAQGCEKKTFVPLCVPLVLAWKLDIVTLIGAIYPNHQSLVYSV
ncbi:hypothetical protein RRG08_028427 [Elysia crispata]|uniref:Uncharacterized protein n=1 Tax=Elysia crispata TaxID=231223 RepID=A0AAE1E5V5_9GAST|nr:hypothetical protein RRG08_028427 [Elysia crispata]